MLNPFSWIRQQSKAAFLAGIADGLQEIAPAEGQPLPTLADLQQRLALPQPPAEAEAEAPPEPTKRGRK